MQSWDWIDECGNKGCCSRSCKDKENKEKTVMAEEDETDSDVMEKDGNGACEWLTLIRSSSSTDIMGTGPCWPRYFNINDIARRAVELGLEVELILWIYLPRDGGQDGISCWWVDNSAQGALLPWSSWLMPLSMIPLLLTPCKAFSHSCSLIWLMAIFVCLQELLMHWWPGHFLWCTYLFFNGLILLWTFSWTCLMHLSFSA